MAPVLYYIPKSLRMGSGSLYETSRGLRSTSQKNTAQLVQCPSTAAALLVERPSVNVVCRSAEAIAETSALGGVNSLQGDLCG